MDELILKSEVLEVTKLSSYAIHGMYREFFQKIELGDKLLVETKLKIVATNSKQLDVKITNLDKSNSVVIKHTTAFNRLSGYGFKGYDK